MILNTTINQSTKQMGKFKHIKINDHYIIPTTATIRSMQRATLRDLKQSTQRQRKFDFWDETKRNINK